MTVSARAWFSLALPAQLLWAAPMLAVLGTSGEVRAAPPASDGSRDPQELFAEGQSLAQTADYAGAIAAFEEAFRLLPDDLAYDSVRNRMRVELVNAHQKAYEVDTERSHLAKAQAIVEDYLANLAGDQDRTWGLERREELQAELDAHDAAAAEAEKAAREAEARKAQAEAEAARQEAEARRLEAENRTNSVDTAADREAAKKRAKTFFIAGGVIGGVGLGGAVLMAVGFSQANSAVGTFTNEPDQRVDARQGVITGNTLGGVGAGVAGVFLITGATLLVLGAQNNRRAKSLAVTPTFGPTQAGLSVTGRF